MKTKCSICGSLLSEEPTVPELAETDFACHENCLQRIADDNYSFFWTQTRYKVWQSRNSEKTTA